VALKCSAVGVEPIISRRLSMAGDNYETAVLEPRALALLSRFEERAGHYDTTRSDQARHSPTPASEWRHNDDTEHRA
jgi:hypothetical protein